MTSFLQGSEHIIGVNAVETYAVMIVQGDLCMCIFSYAFLRLQGRMHGFSRTEPTKLTLVCNSESHAYVT